MATEVWADLDTLPRPAGERDPALLAPRLLAALERNTAKVATAGDRAGGRWLPLAASVLLALAVGGVAGWTVARATAAAHAAPGSAAAPVDGEGQRYLLLLRETDATLGAEARLGTAALVAEYGAWARSLSKAGSLDLAEKLADRGITLSTGTERQVDGGAPGAVSGIFLIRARDPAAAHDLALGSPHVKHGGVIEIRAIESARRAR
jgi:hypothetical protein